MDLVERPSSGFFDFGAGSRREVEGSRSRPKAVTQSAAITMLHAAKKNHPALERNESLKLMAELSLRPSSGARRPE